MNGNERKERKGKGMDRERYTGEKKEGTKEEDLQKEKTTQRKKREVEVKWEGTRTGKREGMKRAARK